MLVSKTVLVRREQRGQEKILDLVKGVEPGEQGAGTEHLGSCSGFEGRQCRRSVLALGDGRKNKRRKGSKMEARTVS